MPVLQQSSSASERGADIANATHQQGYVAVILCHPITDTYKLIIGTILVRIGTVSLMWIGGNNSRLL